MGKVATCQVILCRWINAPFEGMGPTVSATEIESTSITAHKSSSPFCLKIKRISSIVNNFFMRCLSRTDSVRTIIPLRIGDPDSVMYGGVNALINTCPHTHSKHLYVSNHSSIPRLHCKKNAKSLWQSRNNRRGVRYYTSIIRIEADGRNVQK